MKTEWFTLKNIILIRNNMRGWESTYISDNAGGREYCST